MINKINIPTNSSFYDKTDTVLPKQVNYQENKIGYGLPYVNIFPNNKTRVITGVEKINTNLYNLLKTNKGERIFLPDYGINIRSFFYEPNDFIFKDLLSLEIKEAVAKWIPYIQITDIIIETSRRSANVSIEYIVSDLGSKTAFEFDMERGEDI